MITLAVETSCDETAVAVLRDRDVLLASEVRSQIALHRPHGGVVPEIASRDHLAGIGAVLETALRTAGVSVAGVGVFAATKGPGLAPALLVGFSLAKGLAAGADRPFVAVNHLEGHLLSPFFGGDVPPSVALVVSGGHTSLVAVQAAGRYQLLGRTRDDAAGEAFDKVGKLLGLPYPGGPEIEKAARGGNPARFDLPRGLLREGLDFSFSGLKTAVRYLLPSMGPEAAPDLCASFQAAVISVLVEKSIRAMRETGLSTLGLSGGVSCNRALREAFARRCGQEGITLRIADPALCTDNAAMIARVAYERMLAGAGSELTEEIDPALGIA